MLLEACLQSPLGLPNVLELTRTRDLVYHSSLPRERIWILDPGQLLSQCGDGGEYSPDVKSPTHSPEVFTHSCHIR